MMKKAVLALGMAIGLVVVSGCTDADIASSNLSEAADNFQINRRVVFYNGITDTFLLEIQGLCSLGNSDDRSAQVTVTCKVGENEYKKHFLGLSDNVTYFAEQVEPYKTDPYHYAVTFKPQAIVPDINLKIK